MNIGTALGKRIHEAIEEILHGEDLNDTQLTFGGTCLTLYYDSEQRVLYFDWDGQPEGTTMLNAKGQSDLFDPKKYQLKQTHSRHDAQYVQTDLEYGFVKIGQNDDTAASTKKDT